MLRRVRRSVNADSVVGLGVSVHITPCAPDETLGKVHAAPTPRIRMPRRSGIPAPLSLAPFTGLLLVSSLTVAEQLPVAAPDSTASTPSDADAPTEESEQTGADNSARGTSEADAPATESDERSPWHARLPDWVEIDAEYRTRTIYINPLELSGNDVEAIDWTEHRLRLGLALKHGDWFAVRTRLDILDGVLWGDNGEFFGDPSPNSGLALATRRPNATRIDVGLPDGADPLDPESYEPTVVGADAISIDHAYADVVLPFGLLRVGRQPANYGANLGGHDGERHNRWGASSYGDIADRFLFGTKLDEAVRMIRGRGGEPDPGMDNGVILATWMDLYNTGSITHAGDNLRQNGLMLTVAQREADWFGASWRSLAATTALVRLANDDFDTGIWAIPVILKGSVGNFDLEANFSYLTGSTRELSEGMSALTPRPPTLQQMRAYGARVVADYTVGPAMFTLEFDYARGDDDPRHESIITSFSFPRDLNVGLLMFERIIAFESARRAAVGLENLAGLDAPSFPVTEASTEGRFTNAIALFPQVLVNLVDTPEHRFHTRFGVLMAWPAAPGGAVEPVMTTLLQDGSRIDDDAVNYHGGKPGNYYGTEFDLQLGWTFRQSFHWTVEGALLLPGSALEDANGDAVNSFLVENRFEFVF